VAAAADTQRELSHRRYKDAARGERSEPRDRRSGASDAGLDYNAHEVIPMRSRARFIVMPAMLAALGAAPASASLNMNEGL